MDITNQGMNKSAGLLPSQVGSTRYTLMQSVPWFGKRDMKRDAAAAGADQALGKIALTWTELATQIKTAYAQNFYLVGSKISLIAGSCSGILLLVSAVAMFRNCRAGARSAFFITLSLTIFFSYRYSLTHALLPALLAVLSTIMLLILLVSLAQKSPRD